MLLMEACWRYAHNLKQGRRTFAMKNRHIDAVVCIKLTECFNQLTRCSRVHAVSLLRPVDAHQKKPPQFLFDHQVISFARRREEPWCMKSCHSSESAQKRGFTDTRMHRIQLITKEKSYDCAKACIKITRTNNNKKIEKLQNQDQLK